MASAESRGFIAFVAAALSAMTDKEIVTKEEYDVREKLANSGIVPSYTFDDTSTLANYNIRNNSVIKLSVRVKGGSSELFYLDDTYLDPTWDYDFTDIDDGDTEFMRGGHRYYRPCGWKRIAINVLKKYPDGEAWLGNNGSAGEWAVTYHGIKKEFFNLICGEGYKIGSRQRFGPGVYSTSRISIAESYASMFKHNGSWYKGVFQNRVNPNDMIIPKEEPDYRVCQNKKNIRPYGLCVKKVLL